MVTGQRKLASDTALVKKIHTLRGMGLSIRQVAAEVGISHSSVLRLISGDNSLEPSTVGSSTAREA